MSNTKHSLSKYATLKLDFIHVVSSIHLDRSTAERTGPVIPVLTSNVVKLVIESCNKSNLPGSTGFVAIKLPLLHQPCAMSLMNWISLVKSAYVADRDDDAREVVVIRFEVSSEAGTTSRGSNLGAQRLEVGILAQCNGASILYRIWVTAFLETKRRSILLPWPLYQQASKLQRQQPWKQSGSEDISRREQHCRWLQVVRWGELRSRGTLKVFLYPFEFVSVALLMVREKKNGLLRLGSSNRKWSLQVWCRKCRHSDDYYGFYWDIRLS